MTRSRLSAVCHTWSVSKGSKFPRLTGCLSKKIIATEADVGVVSWLDEWTEEAGGDYLILVIMQISLIICTRPHYVVCSESIWWARKEIVYDVYTHCSRKIFEDGLLQFCSIQLTCICARTGGFLSCSNQRRRTPIHIHSGQGVGRLERVYWDGMFKVQKLQVLIWRYSEQFF